MVQVGVGWEGPALDAADAISTGLSFHICEIGSKIPNSKGVPEPGGGGNGEVFVVW